ncbi:hypothetical protein PYCC9005_002827 [Savitreella phatthalungensis]
MPFADEIEDEALVADVKSLVSKYPEAQPVIDRVVDHFVQLQQRPSKRVKLDPSSPGRPSSSASTPSSDPGVHLATIKEVTILTPLRKKLNLVFSTNALSASLGTHPAVKPEHSIPTRSIRYVAVVPVPDKAVASVNVCIFTTSAEPLVFSLIEGSVSGIVEEAGRRGLSPAISTASGGFDAVPFLYHLLGKVLRPGVPIQSPNDADFASTPTTTSTGKRKHQLYVPAHIAAKAGHLFFLPDAILWGFKKPLVLLRHAEIASVAFVNVLSRTFDMSLATRDVAATPAKVDFGMLPTEEFDAVKRYIDSKRIGDASLADDRKAKPHFKASIAGGTATAAVDTNPKPKAKVLAGTIDQIAADSDDSDDENFEDDRSHGGSTVDSDDSGSEEDESDDDADDVDPSDTEPADA